MNRIRFILFCAVFFMTLTGSAVAAQQPVPGGQSPVPVPPPGGVPGAPNRGLQVQSSGVRIEGELAYLKAELKITDAQAKKWDAFAESARESVKTTQAINAQNATITGPRSVMDTMTFRQKYMKSRSDSLAAMLEKFKPLYESFTPEQKASADQLIPMHLAATL